MLEALLLEVVDDVVDVGFFGEVLRHDAIIRGSGGVAHIELAGEGPSEWMRLAPVPVRDETQHRCDQLGNGRERAVLEHASMQNAEPDLDLVYPRRVLRRVDEAEPI